MQAFDADVACHLGANIKINPSNFYRLLLFSPLLPSPFSPRCLVDAAPAPTTQASAPPLSLPLLAGLGQARHSGAHEDK